MLRKALGAGLAGLGLVGGAAAVHYDSNGKTSVTVKDAVHHRTESVQLSGASGKTYSCPPGTRAKIEPHDLLAGRIEITLRHVRKTERTIERRYPNHRAAGSVVDRYNALQRRDHKLVAAFNREVDAHNAILGSDCTT
jgi:hypothetical protein